MIDMEFKPDSPDDCSRQSVGQPVGRSSFARQGARPKETPIRRPRLIRDANGVSANSSDEFLPNTVIPPRLDYGNNSSLERRLLSSNSRLPAADQSNNVAPIVPLLEGGASTTRRCQSLETDKPKHSAWKSDLWTSSDSMSEENKILLEIWGLHQSSSEIKDKSAAFNNAAMVSTTQTVPLTQTNPGLTGKPPRPKYSADKNNVICHQDVNDIYTYSADIYNGEISPKQIKQYKYNSTQTNKSVHYNKYKYEDCIDKLGLCSTSLEAEEQIANAIEPLSNNLQHQEFRSSKGFLNMDNLKHNLVVKPKYDVSQSEIAKLNPIMSDNKDLPYSTWNNLNNVHVKPPSLANSFGNLRPNISKRVEVHNDDINVDVKLKVNKGPSKLQLHNSADTMEYPGIVTSGEVITKADIDWFVNNVNNEIFPDKGSGIDHVSTGNNCNSKYSENEKVWDKHGARPKRNINTVLQDGHMASTNSPINGGLNAQTVTINEDFFDDVPVLVGDEAMDCSHNDINHFLGYGAEAVGVGGFGTKINSALTKSNVLSVSDTRSNSKLTNDKPLIAERYVLKGRIDDEINQVASDISNLESSVSSIIDSMFELKPKIIVNNNCEFKSTYQCDNGKVNHSDNLNGLRIGSQLPTFVMKVNQLNYEDRLRPLDYYTTHCDDNFDRLYGDTETSEMCQLSMNRQALGDRQKVLYWLNQVQDQLDSQEPECPQLVQTTVASQPCKQSVTAIGISGLSNGHDNNNASLHNEHEWVSSRCSKESQQRNMQDDNSDMINIKGRMSHPIFSENKLGVSHSHKLSDPDTDMVSVNVDNSGTKSIPLAQTSNDAVPTKVLVNKSEPPDHRTDKSTSRPLYPLSGPQSVPDVPPLDLVFALESDEDGLDGYFSKVVSVSKRLVPLDSPCETTPASRDHCNSLLAELSSRSDGYADTTPWLYLPDEIWLIILSHLSSSDIVSCSRTSRRLLNVCFDSTLWRNVSVNNKLLDFQAIQSIGRHRMFSFSLNRCRIAEDINSSYLASQIFANSCQCLQVLNLVGCQDAMPILDASCNFSGNIIALDLSWCAIDNTVVTRFFSGATGLTRICINGCSGLDGSSVSMIAERLAIRVKHLELFGCFNLTVESISYLASCVTLKYLNLGQCSKLTDSCLMLIASGMPLLESLDLRWCKLLTDSSVHHVVRNCPSIQSLAVANCPLLSDTTLQEIGVYLPGLQLLNVSGCKKMTSAGFKTLAVNCTKLEFVDASSTGIGNSGVKALVNFCCSTLKELRLNFCTHLTQETGILILRDCPRLNLLQLYGCDRLRTLRNVPSLNVNIVLEL